MSLLVPIADLRAAVNLAVGDASRDVLLGQLEADALAELERGGNWFFGDPPGAVVVLSEVSDGFPLMPCSLSPYRTREERLRKWMHNPAADPLLVTVDVRESADVDWAELVIDADYEVAEGGQAVMFLSAGKAPGPSGQIRIGYPAGYLLGDLPWKVAAGVLAIVAELYRSRSQVQTGPVRKDKAPMQELEFAVLGASSLDAQSAISDIVSGLARPRY